MNKNFLGTKFYGIYPLWVDVMPGKDVSLGIHICWRGRIDFHIFNLIIAIGYVPVYSAVYGPYRAAESERTYSKKYATSNSYHIAKLTKDKKQPYFRAGVPAPGMHD